MLRQHKTYARLGAAIAALLAVAAAPSGAMAWARIKDSSGNNILTWPSNTFSFAGNVNSFTNALNGLTLTSDEARYWITATAAGWKERTGANLTITYSGDTTWQPVSCTGSGNDNGRNDVAAIHACAPGETAPNCATWAQTKIYWNVSTKVITEADICVFGTSDNWGIRMDNIPFAGTKDLAGVLAHEMGHALLLDHTPGTVMDSPSFSRGNTLSRYQYGDDWDGIRSLYGTGNHSFYYRQMPFNTWSAETHGPGYQVTTHANATIGKVGSGQSVLVGSNENGQISIDFTSYPIAASPTWSGNYLGSPSIRPPGVASKLTSQMRVVAYPRKQSTSSSASSAIVVKYSDVDFGTTTNVVTLAGDSATIHDPALTYDPGSDRFILVYARRNSTATKDNQLLARTASASSPGTWSSAQALSDYVTEGPSIACGTGGSCVLAYNTGDSNVPFARNRAITVNSTTGAITMGAWVQSTDIYANTMAASVRTVSPNGSEFALADAFSSPGSDTAGARYWATSLHRFGTPMSWSSAADWRTISTNLPHRPTLAGSTSVDTLYSIVVY